MKQITEDYCSLEIAKLLKQKGFNIPGRSYYNNNDYLSFEHSKGFVSADSVYLLRPTHQMALKWLREVNGIFISIMCCTYPTLNKVTWIPDITTFESVFPDSVIEHDTYEQAVEASLLYVLKNLI